MFDLTYWLMFLAAAFAINISPGPDVIYIMSQTISHGKKVGFCSSWGVCSGAFLQILLVAFGLTTVLAASNMAFTIVKAVGAAYLFYLGFKALFSRKSEGLMKLKGETQLTPWDAYKRGILVDLFNPKATLFFVAFLPQFVRPGAGPFAWQIIGLGFLVLIVAIPIEGSYILLAGKATEVLKRRPAVVKWIDKAMGIVLVGMGVNVLLAVRRE